MHMNKVVVDGLTFEPFLNEKQILERIRKIAACINEQHSHSNPIFIGVLNGCFMFFSDLMKEVTIPCETTFVKLASYSGTKNGKVKQILGMGIDIANRHVVVVEDIVDTGNSLKHIIEELTQLQVASVTVCSLLMKPDCLEHSFDQVMHVGFEIDKEFVVGYGLDYNGYGRNLCQIYRVCS